MRTAPGHAVVIGGGFAGLLAARALSDTFARVTVIERDPRPGPDNHRRGVPQTPHPHGLLQRGATTIEALLPGIGDELRARGAALFDFGEGARILFPAGWAPVGPTGVRHLACSRTLLEGTLRERVTGLPAVDLVPATVSAVLWAGHRATGVRDGSGRTFPADLVVDASGRTTRLAGWLGQGGFPAPPVTRVLAGLSYVTRRFQGAPAADWHLSAEATYAPTIRRGGLVQVIEGQQTLVTLIGADGTRPPHDAAGFRAHAAALRNPHLLEAIDSGTPVGRAHRYGGLDNRWNGYHRTPRWPDNVIALGDSVAALNPIYGHGLTVSALQALALRDLLAHDPRPGLARTFQREAAGIVRVPWLLAALSDTAWRTERRPPGMHAANLALRRVLDLVPSRPRLYRDLVAVQNLLAHPVILAPAALTPRPRT
ncbi:FAD-dependent oxidoreductase [Streptomyces sp. NRRL S-350]|uniref:FAD-dependent oxidoreductase n=1 Tax=Streptomyces sp. NRRL S-350 TaxID=1463902 RepID=UPI00099DD58B|nr:NAD(P)-binding protein [Streptomyces sp. NRRL S-350]